MANAFSTALESDCYLRQPGGNSPCQDYRWCDGNSDSGADLYRLPSPPGSLPSRNTNGPSSRRRENGSINEGSGAPNGSDYPFSPMSDLPQWVGNSAAGKSAAERRGRSRDSGW